MLEKNQKLFIGLMSGTSMDGIDAALIELPSNHFISGITYPYSAYARELLTSALSPENQEKLNFSFINHLNTVLGKEFAQATFALLEEAKMAAKQIEAIGSHGQTLYHDSISEKPYTVQLGCAHTIAELTGITVVADFRTRDLVVKGRGAPFAPLYHQRLFKHHKKPLAVVNIGGIANITYLQETEVTGHDVGPGNCLMDAWIHFNLGEAYDKGGDWAASGKVIEPLLENLKKDAFFQKAPPKSIGKEYFSLFWLRQYLSSDYQAKDIQATLLMLTVSLISHAIKTGPIIEEVLICGGGVHNTVLLRSLEKLLPKIRVSSTAKYNISPDFIEASMFAWLADKTLNGIALDMTNITGATHPSILGAIYPKTSRDSFSRAPSD